MGMVTTTSPSPLKIIAAGFCKGAVDTTDENGEATGRSLQGAGTANYCQVQLISLAKHAWDGCVWERMKRELMLELVNAGYTIKPPQ